MKDSEHYAHWILNKISTVNPHTTREKNLAFIWAAGFLARCCAEMIWRDSRNLDIFLRILEKNQPK